MAETFQDEEVGEKTKGKKTKDTKDFRVGRVSDIEEETESMCSASLARKPSQDLTEKALLEDLTESIASITCPEQEVTQQMLLCDLVPTATAANILHESYSSVPFSGGDFMPGNLLGGDGSESDSSVPFQGGKTLLDDSSSSGDPLDGSVSEGSNQGEVSESKIPSPETESPSTDTSSTDLSRSASNYSQHLLRSSSSPQTDTNGSKTGNCQSLSRSNPEHESSRKETESPPNEEERRIVVEPMIIATIENRTATKATEIPFSSRFVEYKNRLSLIRPEDETLSTADSPTQEASQEDSSTKSDDKGMTPMRDKSSRNSTSSGGNMSSFQMMNEYIVQSMRDGSVHSDSSSDSDSSRDRMDFSERRRYDISRGGPTSRKMKDDSGRVGAARGSLKDRSMNDRSMKDRSSGFLARLMSDSSSGRSNGSRKMKDRSFDSINDRIIGRHKITRSSTDPVDHRRRRIQESQSLEESELYPWESTGDDTSASASAMLGYNLPDEWQNVGGGTTAKKKKGMLKSTMSALNQSMSAFQFSSGSDSPDKRPRATTKPKGRFAAMNMSLPALHYTHGSWKEDDEDDDDEEGSDGVNSLDLYQNEH